MATLLTTARAARIQARIDAYEAHLAALEDTFLTLSGRILKEYRVDTAEGMERGETQEVTDLLEAIFSIESRIESLYAKLGGRGVTNVVLRRNANACRRI
jgi:hypothetical protein